MKSKSKREVEELIEKLSRIQCRKDSTHKAYDFICVALPRGAGEGGGFERFVCMDCLKANPEYFQKYSSSFLRIPDFVQKISEPPLKKTDSSILEDVKEFEARYRALKDRYEGYASKEISEIEKFFDNAKIQVFNLISERMNEICQAVASEFKKNLEFEISEIDNILSYSAKITKFSDGGYVKDFLEILDQSSNSSWKDLVNKISEVSLTMDKYERLLKDWHVKIQGYGAGLASGASSSKHLGSYINFSKIEDLIGGCLADFDESLSSVLDGDLGYLVDIKNELCLNEDTITEFFSRTNGSKSLITIGVVEGKSDRVRLEGNQKPERENISDRKPLKFDRFEGVKSQIILTEGGAHGKNPLDYKVLQERLNQIQGQGETPSLESDEKRRKTPFLMNRKPSQSPTFAGEYHTKPKRLRSRQRLSKGSLHSRGSLDRASTKKSQVEALSEYEQKLKLELGSIDVSRFFWLFRSNQLVEK